MPIKNDKSPGLGFTTIPGLCSVDKNTIPLTGRADLTSQTQSRKQFFRHVAARAHRPRAACWSHRSPCPPPPATRPKAYNYHGNQAHGLGQGRKRLCCCNLAAENRSIPKRKYTAAVFVSHSYWTLGKISRDGRPLKNARLIRLSAGSLFPGGKLPRLFPAE